MKKSNIVKLNNKRLPMMERAGLLARKIDKVMHGHDVEIIANAQLLLLKNMLKYLSDENREVFIISIIDVTNKFTPVPTQIWYLFDDDSLIHEDDFVPDENHSVTFRAYQVPVTYEDGEAALEWIKNQHE